MEETTTPVLSRLDARERAALQRWTQERAALPGTPERLSDAEAMRFLTREALERMGLLEMRR